MIQQSNRHKLIVTGILYFLQKSWNRSNIVLCRQRQRRPDRAVYVPRGRRSQTTPPSAPVNNSIAEPVSKTTNVIPAAKSPPIENLTNSNPSTHNQVIEPTEKINVVKPIEQIEVIDKKSKQDENHLQNSNINNSTMPKLNSGTNHTSSDKDYNEEKEFQRASKVRKCNTCDLNVLIIFFLLFKQEINRRNRRIIKQTFDSDVLEINDTLTAQKSSSSPPTASHLVKKPNLPQTEVQCKNAIKKPNDKSAVNPETDDWETMFDETGECLDPKLVDEITASVGKVTITKPKSNYKSYQEPINLDEEEFPHVLEVSNFPIEFKTPDLMQLFANYKDTGYDIKWVDDTHALVVFSSSKIGKKKNKK